MGKSSILELISSNAEKKKYFLVYKINTKYYCYFLGDSEPTIDFFDIKFINAKCINDSLSFFPKIENLVQRTEIEEETLKYVSFNGSPMAHFDREMNNDYLMESPQFFIPMYVNIYRKNIRKFETNMLF